MSRYPASALKDELRDDELKEVTGGLVVGVSQIAILIGLLLPPPPPPPPPKTT